MSSTTRSKNPGTHAPGQITLGEMLADRAFSLYLIGQTTSGAGSALSGIAMVFAVLSLSRSPSSVGLVLLASRVPGIALTLAGGVIADRCSRKRIATYSDATRTALQAITATLLLSGHATVFEIAALQLFAGGASAIFAPAAGALAAGIAPQGQIRRAASLLGITKAVAQTGGLAVSGVIVALAGPATSFLIDSATFAISSLTFALMPLTPAIPPERRSALAQLREGGRTFMNTRWLVIYAFHVTALNVLALSPFFVLGPVIAKQHLGGAPAWSAIALGYVLGNLAAAHITYHWAPKRPMSAALSMSLALIPMLTLLGLHAPIWLIAPASLLAGAQSTIYNTLTTSTTQANLPSNTLGRASAITGLGSTILAPIAMGLAGITAETIGTSTVLLGGSAAVLTLTITCLFLPATRERLSIDIQGRPPEPSNTC